MDYDNVDSSNVARHTETLISRMDTFGVQRAVLTPANPMTGNEVCLEAAAIYPDRLFSSCMVMPRPLDGARKKVKKYVDQDCKALIIDERFCYPGDPATLALVGEAIGAGIPVMFHNEIMRGDWFSFVDNASILHPEGKFVILQMGGLFGFPQMIPLLTRENVWMEISVNLVKLVESHLRVFLDAVVQDMGVSKLVFGSEHHSEYPDIMASLNLIDLNIETSRVIQQENAWLLLGLDFSW
jgi:predicted TIM-barrel fold metal-dependent hydrolase